MISLSLFRSRRSFIIAIGGLLSSYIAICFYFWIVQVEKIFEPVPEILTTPDRMGMGYARVKIPAGTDGDRYELDGFWVPAKELPAPAFLYLHGQDATIGKNLEHTLRLHELGYSVLVVDYRGYGESFGKTDPSEESVYEDSEAAWAYLKERPEIDSEKGVFIFGHSLGGAIAIELSIRQTGAAGVITEGAFTSIHEMTEQRYGGLLRLLPMNLLVNHRFESLEKIASIEIPVMLIHGTHDQKVPAFMSKRLFEAASNPKELLLIQGGEHRNSGSIGRIEYMERVKKFVEQHAPRAEHVHAADSSPAP